MPYLDIIVTHHDEPWDVGKPFFDMIENQRCVGKDEYTVTLVQDGPEHALPWADLMVDYSFRVNIITVPESGIAAARNAGMKATSSQWIMFCHFCDMFNDLCAIRMIINNFPVDCYDLIWGTFVTEEKWNGGNPFINTVKEPVLASTDCKFYRRDFLTEHNITFNTSVPLHEEYIFNALVVQETAPFRVVTLTTDFYPYCHTYRNGDSEKRLAEIIQAVNTRFDRNYAIAQTFKRRGYDFAYKKQIALIACNEYYRIYNPDEEEPAQPSAKFVEFYMKHKDIIRSLSPAEMDVIKDEAETETMNIVQNIYNDFLKEYYFSNDSIPFEQWLDDVENMHAVPLNNMERMKSADEMPEPIVISSDPLLLRGNQYSAFIPEEQQDTAPVPAPAQAPEREPKVAVYCGTYNTYANMVASAKSLLWHTPMDKVYFLIEDDVFPYELPDIIECINVKNQTFFPEDGPNYKNPWSYMCMMRAVFTKLIPYKKIISFDIDVVIQEDISCLWDIDMSDYYLAGVIEPQRQKSSADPIYINFGVVMMNLDKLRADGIDDKVIAALNTQRFGCPEQDAFNKFCALHIYQLPNDYNATIHSHITGDAERERILHFAGIKFWRHYGQVKEYAMRQWDAVMERQASLHA